MTVTSSTCITVTVMTVAVIAQRRTRADLWLGLRRRGARVVGPLIAPPGSGTRSPGIVAPAVLPGQLVEPRLEVGVERLVHRGQEVVELLGPAGAEMGDVMAGCASTQATASAASDMPASRGERAQGLDRGELALVPVAVLVALARRCRA